MISIETSFSEPFVSLQPQILKLIKQFQLEEGGTTLHQQRDNLTKKFKIKDHLGRDLLVVVKKYNNSNLLKTVLRKSKAKNSMLKAKQLLEHGISVPEPIAFINFYKFKICRECYYISRYWTNNVDLKRILIKGFSKGINSQLLFLQLSQFLYLQHNNGFYQRDNNPTNILARRGGGEYKFAVIDYDRLKIKNLEINDRIRAIVQLSPHLEFVMQLGKYYNKLYRYDSRDFNKKICEDFNSRRSKYAKGTAE